MNGAFAAELRRAMDEQGIGARQLAEAVGLTPFTIWAYLRTGRIPSLDIADRLAETLDCPQLRQLSASRYSRRCSMCRRKYQVDSRNSGRKRFCSKRCLRAAYNRRRRTTRRDLAFAEAEAMRQAIAAHCRDCEPLGICRDSACHLRGVSPLPFVPMSSIRKAA